MKQFILAIDQGTTGTTSLLFDQDLKIYGKTNVEFPQHFPKPNWVEHDLNEIWKSVCESVTRTISESSLDPKAIVAIGITNQRETTCVWEKTQTATPLYNAIVWQDRRTATECEKLKARGFEKKINQKTGLLLDPYFSGTKLAWILKNVPGVAAKAKTGQIAFGTIESYLLYRLTGEHRTEPSNASRTLLMNLKTCQWDEDLIKLFGIPRAILPEIFPSAVEYGRTKNFLTVPDGTPVTGLAGDQQAALFGQACFEKGSAKCTYGTGAFALLNTGKDIKYSKHRLLTTVAWKLGKDVTYALEGSAFIAGASVQWLRDGLTLFESSSQVEQLAEGCSDSDGVTFVPALSGMGAPHWLARATGLITGITRRTTKAHVARATLEGIGFQVGELLKAMGKDLGKTPNPLKVDGGASQNNLLMQFQADILGVDVVRSAITETTALGSGLQAGLAIGFWKDLNDIRSRWKAAETFKPLKKPIWRKQEMARWERAVKAVALLSQK